MYSIKIYDHEFAVKVSLIELHDSKRHLYLRRLEIKKTSTEEESICVSYSKQIQFDLTHHLI